MNTTTPNPPHALSGHNPTLFNVVVQYADMDMLRALALTSHSLHEALKKCHFDHLTMVVLEAPILEEQQQIVYNGANPVPADTFLLTMNDIVATPTPGNTISGAQAFDAWKQRSVVCNHYTHDIIIPDYARNFMARAQSVELIVYRPHLGTRISSYFTNNARHLKRDGPTTADECTSFGETAQYTLHLPRPPSPHAPHRHTSDERTHGNKRCIFSDHPSHEYFECDLAESRRHIFHKVPGSSQLSGRGLPFENLPFLQLNFMYNPINADLEDENCSRRHTDNTFYRNGHDYISANSINTSVLHPRLQNLPLPEQQALTTSLKIHIDDCVTFGVEDWRNAIPGCTVQPVQTWIIHDDTSMPQHSRHTDERIVRMHADRFCERRPTTAPTDVDYVADNNIGPHFPRLASLVLQYTPSDPTNWCNTDRRRVTSIIRPFRLAHFFIDGDITHLPHLQHFGVVGTFLDHVQYATVALSNTHICSLNISPRPTNKNSPSLSVWINKLCVCLNKIEDLDTYSRYTAPNGITHPEPPGQSHGESIQPMEITELTHKSRPRRKYNFSLDFTPSCLESLCPNTPFPTPLPQETPLQVCYHPMTCASIHDSLSSVYKADQIGHEVRCRRVLVLEPPFALTFPFHTYAKSADPCIVIAIAMLAQHTLTYLEMRCRYFSHDNPGATPFPGASPGDCTATHLPPPADAPLGITDLPQDDGNNDNDSKLPQMRHTRPNMEMYMRLRELLCIPKHVVLRL